MANLTSAQIKSDPEGFDFETSLPLLDDYIQDNPDGMTPVDGMVVAEEDTFYQEEVDEEMNEMVYEKVQEEAKEKVKENEVKEILAGSHEPNQSYRLFGSSSIQVMAEQSDLHMDFYNDVASTISQDLGYRVRELIHCSAQLIRHSSRTTLTTKDIFKAMQTLHCDTIFGHNNPPKSRCDSNYKYVPEASVFVKEDPTVNLKVSSAKIISRRQQQLERSLPSTAIFNVDWLQSKNFICDNLENTSTTTAKLTAISPNKEQLNQQFDTYFAQLSDTIAGINSSKFAHLALSERELLLSLIYCDLATNTKIKPVLNRFIKFALNALRALQRFAFPANIDPLVFSQTKLESYNIYLKTIRALMNNKHFIDWSMHSDSMCNLSQVLLTLCFDLRLCGDLSLLYHNSLQIRSQCAWLFGQILFKFCLPFSDLQNQLICQLYTKIRDYHTNMNSLSCTERASIDYTILLLHRFLGFDFAYRFLMPLLKDMPFMEYFAENVSQVTQSKVQASLQHVATSLVRGEICQVGELIMKGLALLMVQVVDDSVCIDNSNEIYAYFYEHFGDSLCSRLSPLPELACIKSKSRSKWINTWRPRFCRSNATVTNSKHLAMDSDNKKQFLPVTPVTNHRTRTDSTSKQDLPETSPSGRNRKRKGTGLLESMLSTDTSMMAKNESLSMFTESLLEASHRQYEKNLPSQTFLYPEDYEEFLQKTESTACSSTLIVFTGKRKKKYAAEESAEPSPEPPKGKLKYPANQSEWHTLCMERRSSFTKYLRSFPGPHMFAIQQVELGLGVNEGLMKIDSYNTYKLYGSISQQIQQPDEMSSGEPKPSADSTQKRTLHWRHRHIFHYHRIKQHLRTNFSLFTQL